MESIGRPRGCDHDEPFVLGIFRAAAKRENTESPRSLVDERAAINQSIEGTRSAGRSSFVEVIKLIEPSSAVHRRLSQRPRYRANVSRLFSHRQKRPFFLGSVLVATRRRFHDSYHLYRQCIQREITLLCDVPSTRELEFSSVLGYNTAISSRVCENLV